MCQDFFQYVEFPSSIVFRGNVLEIDKLLTVDGRNPAPPGMYRAL